MSQQNEHDIGAALNELLGMQQMSQMSQGSQLSQERARLEAQIESLKMQQASLPSMDLNKIFSDTFARAGTASIPGLTPAAMSVMTADMLNHDKPSPAHTPTESTRSNRKHETAEEKQERIRQRNRDHARKCRERKKQAADTLQSRASKLQSENDVLKSAFRALHNQKTLMESIVISEFGERGYNIIEKARHVKVMGHGSIPQLCKDVLGSQKEEEQLAEQQHYLPANHQESPYV